MNKLLVVALAAVACAADVAAADPADTHPDLHLIPWPKKLQAGEGRLRLTADSRVVAEHEGLLPLAKVLAEEFATLTDLKLEAVKGKGRPGDVVLRLGK